MNHPYHIIQFDHGSPDFKKRIREFVDFHWYHYQNDPKYIPLLDFEYLGFKLLGIHGFFEKNYLFYKHAETVFFLVYQNGTLVGRCNAFVNHNYNHHWNEKTGFFGQFECIEDPQAAALLLDHAADWLRSRGMDNIRGPQNYPVNEATPGILTEGFSSRPVIYYHYNKPYYPSLLEASGFQPVERVLSWEVPVNNPMEEKLERVAQLVMKRHQVRVERWNERPYKVRKQEMFEIYNDAWSDNFGFVPFTFEEFSQILDDMKMIMDKDLYLFVYVKDEPAAFFGGVPNISELLVPRGTGLGHELMRAIRMLTGIKKVKGFRLGYLGVKKKFRRYGLEGVMLWKQKIYSQEAGYEYCDMGWVLEDNTVVVNLIQMMNPEPSKIYTIYNRKL